MSGIKLAKKSNAGRKPVHGMTGTQEHKHWMCMMKRCYRPSDKSYAEYGGRGIKVCKRWHNFANFHRDMGRKPDGMYLDRINNNGSYSPKNCRWATPKESANNRRNSRIVKIGTKKMTLTEWCDVLGAPNSRVHARVYVHGWDPAVALLAPVNTRGKYLRKIDPPATGEHDGVPVRKTEPVSV